MLHIYHSNRLERLAQQLAKRLGKTRSPFEPDVVVVEQAGMARWLSLFLARRHGICANMEFPLPANFIWQVLHCLLEETPGGDEYTPQIMQWRLFELLSQSKNSLSDKTLQDYLNTGSDLDVFELCAVIAHCFDQYQVYRPDWIISWEQQRSAVRGDDWQSDLWRQLVAQAGDIHWAGMLQNLNSKLDVGLVDAGRLPGAVSIFAPSTLSPTYIDVLQWASQWMEINLYLVNPSPDLWMDQVTLRQQARQQLQGGSKALYLEVGNPLLSSLGVQRKDFFTQLLSIECEFDESYMEPQGDKLLGQIQQDLFNAYNPADGDTRVVQDGDDSLQIHSCHSPMREIEVLHDQLLNLFQSYPHLESEDVLVLTPDINTYAPYIEAVFGEHQREHSIPFVISDREAISHNLLAKLLIRLLDMADGRFPASEVIALLESPLISNRFGIAEEDVPLVIEWIRSSRVRWGLDRESRVSRGGADTAKNSWEFGLDRLLLGYALPHGDAFQFAGIAPQPEVEGNSAHLLGGLCEFVEQLNKLGQLSSANFEWPQWKRRILQLLSDFFVLDNNDEDASWLIAQLEEVFSVPERAGVSQPLSLSMVRQYLRQQLQGALSQGRFLGGGVNFAALIPNRCLPFSVICLLGMDELSFPRKTTRAGFDLLQSDFRLGDRSRRDEDKTLFLEVLMHCRHTLYISFTGQSNQDNSSLAPSPLVSELIEYLNTVYSLADGSKHAGDSLVTQHPLQPYSPRYFEQHSKLFSYCDESYEGAKQLLVAADAEPVPFITTALPEPDSEWRRVGLSQLIDFYSNPARFLLQHRLHVFLYLGDELLEDRDPYSLDYFSRADLFQRLLQGVRAGIDCNRLIQAEQARGELPHGAYGNIELEQMLRTVQMLYQKMQMLGDTDSTRWYQIEYVSEQFTLSGYQSDNPVGLYGAGIQPITATKLLELWIRHLARQVSGLPLDDATGTWLEREREIRFHPTRDPESHLDQLLSFYWAGLTQPLPFFPKSALALAKSLQSGKEEVQALQDAERVWRSEHGFPESANPYYQQLLGPGWELDQEFVRVGSAVFTPLLQNVEGL